MRSKGVEIIARQMKLVGGFRIQGTGHETVFEAYDLHDLIIHFVIWVYVLIIEPFFNRSGAAGVKPFAMGFPDKEILFRQLTGFPGAG